MTTLDAPGILAKARIAQHAWAQTPVKLRSVALGRLRLAIARQCEAIAELIARETKKPVLDALSGDVMVTLEMLRYYESSAAKILQTRRLRKPGMLFRGTRFESQFEPHGVALIFGPSNYPFQLSMVPMVTALAAGNAVVLKCSEATPDTAGQIAALCAEASLPPNLMQVLHARPEESGVLIEAGPDIIFFTGSSRNGQLVAAEAAKHLIPTIMELGGKDAALIFADCHLERAVEGIAYGAFSNSGRVCVGVKRAYVEAPIYDAFLERFGRRTAELRVGMDTDADLCPLSGPPLLSLREQIEDALTRGATLHWPRNRDEVGTGPVLLTGVPSQARLLQEESFGPILCVAPFTTEAEALSFANESAFALGCSVWTGDLARARRLATGLSAGSCAVNDVIRVIANPYAAFGGNKLSGHGRYHGPEGLRAFSRVKTVMFANDRKARDINWFPFTARTRKRLAALLRWRHGQAGWTAWLSRALPIALLTGMLCTPSHPQTGRLAKLTIDVRLTPGARGELAYLIFDSSSGFPGDVSKAVRHDFTHIPAGAQELRISTELPPGKYAVTVYEDLNGNHKLDHNLIGIPREPVGVSNNPPSRMGPPRFNECAFRLGQTAQTINITLVQGI